MSHSLFTFLNLNRLTCVARPFRLEHSLKIIVRNQFLFVHTIEMLLDAVLMLCPITAQRARVHGRQAAFDTLVPSARVLGLVGTSATVASIDGGSMLIGGAQHVQCIDGGRCNGCRCGMLLVNVLRLVVLLLVMEVLVMWTGDGDRCLPDQMEITTRRERKINKRNKREKERNNGLVTLWYRVIAIVNEEKTKTHTQRKHLICLVVNRVNLCL